MDIFGEIWDWITNLLETVLTWALNCLPPSPFTLLNNSPLKPYLGWLNWALPVNEAITTLEIWLVSVGIYYTYQVVLRWLKAIN